MRRLGPLALSIIGVAGAVTAALVPAGAAAAAGVTLVTDPAAAVNTFIGTSNGFDDFPGADAPFGMLQWSPDTPSRPSGGGYEYTDKTLTGFSLTHLSGPGCPALGDVPILPTVGAIGSSPGSAQAAFAHTSEQSSPGYYQVTAGGVQTQLATTLRSGIGRFTFPAGTSSNLLFKLSDSAGGNDATHFQVINDHEVAGWVQSGHFCNATDQYNVYFDMRFDQPFTAQGTWQNGTVSAGSTSMTDRPATPKAAPKVKVNPKQPTYHGPTPTGAASVTPKISPPVSGIDGGYVTFDTTKNQTVQAKVGISYVSTDNAVAEPVRPRTPAGTQNTVRTATHNAWNKVLGKIQVGGGTAAAQQVFYTALYHALLHPNVVSDVNGEYMGFDGQPHHVTAGHVRVRQLLRLGHLPQPGAVGRDGRAAADQ